MTKTAFARHQASKRIKKYQEEVKCYRYDLMLEFIGFGRSFKKDPWDCGNPGCFACHPEPRGMSSPTKVRKEELAVKELIDEL